jgi:flagellar basal body-associated protein FliL
MQFKILFFITVAVLAIACGGSGVNTNSNASNANSVPSNSTQSDGPLAVSTPTPEATTNNAPTLTPVYKAYCAAMEKKDEAALRKVFSTETLQYFAGEMKEDNVKTLVDLLSDEQVSSDLCEVRNEQINGDTGVAEVRTKGYPNGLKLVFVKENGEWKLTTKSPNIDAVKRSAN